MTMTEHVRSLGTPAAGALAVVGFWLSAWLLGRLFMALAVRRGQEPGRASGDRAAWSCLTLMLGANLLSLLVLLAGMARWLRAETARMALLTGGIAGAALVVCEVRKAFSANMKWRIHPGWLWIVPAGLPLLGSALCLPIGWDEQVYQVAVPWRWLQDGFPACYPDLPYAAFPDAGTMPVWLVLAAGDIFAPRLLIFSQWLLLGWGLAQLLRRHDGSRWTAMALTAVFLLSPTLLVVVGKVYMEPFLLLNCLGFLLLLDRTEAEPPLIWLSGIFAGAIFATKLTGFLILPALLVAWGQRHDQDRRDREWWCRRLLAAGVGLAFLAPFYLRPWLLTGNPFYPYYGGWFGATAGELASSEYHQAIGNIKYGLGGLAGLLWNPILLAWSLQVYDGHLGWAYLGVLALAGWASWGDRHARACLLMAGLAYLVWFLTAMQARFLLPGFLFLMPAAAIGLARLSRPWRQRATLALAALCLVSISLKWLNHSRICWQAVVGITPQINLLHGYSGRNYLPTLEMIARRTPPGARIMMLFEHRTLYLPRRTVIATPFFQGRLFTPPETVTPAEIIAACRQAGCSHLLVGLSLVDPDRLPAYLDRCVPLAMTVSQLVNTGALEPLGQSTGFILYAVAPPTPSGPISP